MGRPRTAGGPIGNLSMTSSSIGSRRSRISRRLLQFTKRHDAVCIGELRALTQVAVYRKTSDGILKTERPRSVLIIFRRRKMECRSHRRQVDERVGLHLLHYPASMGFHRDLADAELKRDLLV